MRVERGQLVGRESQDVAGSFKLTGEEVSTWVDVGLSRGRWVGPKRTTKWTWETSGCHDWGSGTRCLSEGTKVVGEGIVHLVTGCWEM